MIGFYDYTVVLTYIGFASGITGMFCASTRHLRWAVFFLAFSGLCDMFDGKIARTKKNRTEDEKNFGIQIDSLCDIVCFGILPVLICFKLGMRHIYSMAILIFYALAGVIRLGYFNVLETKRQQVEEGANKYYHGLPITSMAIVLPLIFMLQVFISNAAFIVVLHISLLVVGLLFIVDFRLKKPNNTALVFLVLIVAAAVVIVILFSNFRIPRMQFPNTGLLDCLRGLIGK